MTRTPLSREEQRAYARGRWDKDTIRQIARDLGRPESTVASWGERGGWGHVHRRGFPSRVDWAEVRRRLDAGEPWRAVLDDWRATRQECWLMFRRRGWLTPSLRQDRVFAVLRPRRPRRLPSR